MRRKAYVSLSWFVIHALVHLRGLEILGSSIHFLVREESPLRSSIPRETFMILRGSTGVLLNISFFNYVSIGQFFYRHFEGIVFIMYWIV